MVNDGVVLVDVYEVFGVGVGSDDAGEGSEAQVLNLVLYVIGTPRTTLVSPRRCRYVRS